MAGTVKDLMGEGRVLRWGLSEMGPNTLRRAPEILPLSAVQSGYSMLWRGQEADILPITWRGRGANGRAPSRRRSRRPGSWRRGLTSCPSPGTTQPPHLSDTISAARVAFTESGLVELTAALDAIEVRGNRAPPVLAAWSDVAAPDAI